METTCRPLNRGHRERFKHQRIANSSAVRACADEAGVKRWASVDFATTGIAIQATIWQLIISIQATMNRTDLELVVAVRDRGSLAAAALFLGLAAPVATKRLAALEAKVGQRLFQRTTRRVSVTAEGEIFCARAVVLLQGFAALEAELQESQSEPSGLIRLASTFGFGRLWLGPALAIFQARYPRTEIQLQLTEQLPDLAAERFDGAIWLWALTGGRGTPWVSRRLGRNQRVLVASPDYLSRHEPISSPEGLKDQACLVVRENGVERNISGAHGFDTWHLQKDRDKSSVRVRVHGPLSSNSGELVRDWCLSGHGIMLRSLWDIAPQLATGELVRVLPAYSMPDADIQWLAPHRPDAPRRIRLLIDFLADQFAKEPWKNTPSAKRPVTPGGRPASPVARPGSRPKR
jgi:LysR family transcriptional regulator, transcriptional activator for dmlA